MDNMISLDKVKLNVIPEFIDTRLLSSAPSPLKFIIGGATPLVLNKFDAVIDYYKKPLEMLEILDKDNNLDIDKANVFINSGFNKSGKFEFGGFIFSKADGEAFVNILNKYKNEL